MTNVPEFSKDAFLYSSEPYALIYKYKTDGKPFEMQAVKNALRQQAQRYRVTQAFEEMLRRYESSLKGEMSKNGGSNETAFGLDGREWRCGDWSCDEYGIVGITRYGEEIACHHPLLITERYVNIDTNSEKVKLMYKKGGRWREKVADKSTVYDKRKILQLTDSGIDVTSESSGLLVRYLSEFENLNYNDIPEYNSVGRLGWVSNEQFSPFVENLIFDGEDSFKYAYRCVSYSGSYDKWLSVVREIRKNSDLSVKVVLAASFASAILEKLGISLNFVHLWGLSGKGKTVALMLAASVWGNPPVGKYTITYDATGVGLEMMCGFLNSLPLCVDELQVKSDQKDFDQMIYKLCEGSGRIRGSKTGGIQKQSSWHNMILSCGEMPIINDNSQTGARSRVIEIDCGGKELFGSAKAAKKVADDLRKNYGHAGKRFIDLFLADNADEDKSEKPDVLAELRQFADEFNDYFTKQGVTDKQARTASAILAADRIIENYIFFDEQTIPENAMLRYLLKKDDVDIHLKTYDYLIDTIEMNINKFDKNSQYGEIWGEQDENYYYIYGTQARKIVNETNDNFRGFTKWLADNGKIKKFGKNENGKLVRTPDGRDRMYAILKPGLILPETDEIARKSLKRQEISGFTEANDEPLPF